MKHFVIYIPGLGDDVSIRNKLLTWWRFRDVQVQLVPMNWYGEQDFKKKQTLVLQAFDAAASKGFAVSLIGESAGASMAINAAALRPATHRVVTIAGLNDTFTDISPSISRRSPSFVKSVKAIKSSMALIDTNKIHTIRGLLDFTVYARHTRIDSAHNHVIPAIGHIVTIGLCLTLFSPYVLSLIKRG